jgi:hypothetical protein
MIIVDGRGVVRDVRLGFEPDLREGIGRTIEALLAEHGAAGSQAGPGPRP